MFRTTRFPGFGRPQVVAAGDRDPSATRPQIPRHDLHRGALAGAVRPQQAGPLASIHLDAHILRRVQVAVISTDPRRASTHRQSRIVYYCWRKPPCQVSVSPGILPAALTDPATSVLRASRSDAAPLRREQRVGVPRWVQPHRRVFPLLIP